MWQRYNQCLEVGGALNQGFPFSPLMSHFRGLRDGLEYKFLDCIQDHHQVRNRNGALGWSGFPLFTRTIQAGQGSDGGGGGCKCTLRAGVVLCSNIVGRAGLGWGGAWLTGNVYTACSGCGVILVSVSD